MPGRRRGRCRGQCRDPSRGRCVGRRPAQCSPSGFCPATARSFPLRPLRALAPSRSSAAWRTCQSRSGGPVRAPRRPRDRRRGEGQHRAAPDGGLVTRRREDRRQPGLVADRTEGGDRRLPHQRILMPVASAVSRPEHGRRPPPARRTPTPRLDDGGVRIVEQGGQRHPGRSGRHLAAPAAHRRRHRRPARCVSSASARSLQPVEGTERRGADGASGSREGGRAPRRVAGVTGEGDGPATVTGRGGHPQQRVDEHEGAHGQAGQDDAPRWRPGQRR